MPEESDEDPIDLRGQLEQFESASLESLQKQPESTSEDVRGFKIANDLKQAKLNRSNQQNDLRDRFFIWTFVLATVIIGGNFLLMGYYAYSLKGDVPPNVMMFWISSTVVQILGIVYIIAQYLFPKPKGESRKK